MAYLTTQPYKGTRDFFPEDMRFREAMFAVRNGLSKAQALDAITIEPAKLLGIADRTGSLAPGKDADFVVWSTDPLDPAAQATSVHIDGIPVLAPR